MEYLSKFKVWPNTKDWYRNPSLYWIYVKSFYTVQNWRNNVFEATKILDSGLWVGNICSAFDKNGLDENGISTVVSAIYGAKSSFPFDYHYERANLRDVENEDLISEIESILPIIHQNLEEGKGVLVHCMEGRSRSVSICIAYMVRYLGYTVDSSLRFIKEKRSCINPNQGYLDQLYDYQDSLLTKETVISSGENSSLSWEELTEEFESDSFESYESNDNDNDTIIKIKQE